MAIRRNLPGDEYAALPSASWMRPILQGVEKNWTDAKTEDDKAISTMMNTEFKATADGDGNFQSANFGVVTSERADTLALKHCKVLLPSQNQLQVYAYTSKQGMPSSPKAAYGGLRDGTKAPVGKGRLIDAKWSKTSSLV